MAHEAETRRGLGSFLTGWIPPGLLIGFYWYADLRPSGWFVAVMAGCVAVMLALFLWDRRHAPQRAQDAATAQKAHRQADSILHSGFLRMVSELADERRAHAKTVEFARGLSERTRKLEQAHLAIVDFPAGGGAAEWMRKTAREALYDPGPSPQAIRKWLEEMDMPVPDFLRDDEKEEHADG